MQKKQKITFAFIALILLIALASVLFFTTRGQKTTVWEEALTVLPSCDIKNPGENALKNNAETYEEIFGDFFIQGFPLENMSACYDTTSSSIAYILAKQDLTTSQDGTQLFCDNNCDTIVLGVIDPHTGKNTYQFSMHHLGIFSESYNQYCAIDHVDTQQNISLYCGSGENGGFTHWYYYELKNDTLTEVQRMTTLNPETFDIFDDELLSAFHYRSNAQMH